MDKSRPQLSVDELRQLRWLLGGLLVLVAISSVGYMDVDAWLLAILTAAAVLAVLARPDLPARAPLFLHRIAFPLIAGLAAWDYYASAELLPAMVHLDFMLLLYRAVSYRKKRDDLQIIVLGLFLVIVAGVLTESLTFAAHILVFAAATLAFLFVITLTESAEAGVAAAGVPAFGVKTGGAHGRGAAPEWTSVKWRRFAVRLGEAANWRLIALGAGLFLGVVAVSALLFLAIPRFQIDSGLFLNRFMTKRSRTGFSDSIRLGDVVDIQKDDSIALRVDVSDPSHIPSTPYWRMVVLDEYKEGVFRTSQRLKDEFARSTRRTSWLRGLPGSAGWPVVWTFYLEPGVSRFLPVEGPFERLRFGEVQAAQSNESLRIVALRNDPVTMTAYRVEGAASDGYMPDRRFGGILRQAQQAPPASSPGAGRSRASAAPRVVYPLTTLELPENPADVAALRNIDRQIAGGSSLGAAQFSERASRWLTRRHSYSLQVNLAGGDGDRAVAWMLSRSPGYCELFAVSFTLLARAEGFPTRVVTGFKGGDWNSYEDYFMVRDSDAHAWCEIYDGRAGWIRVDPTDGSAPLNTGTQGAAGAVRAVTRHSDRTWSARLDALRILWYRRIVSFDQQTQFALLVGLKDTTSRFGATLRSYAANAFRAVLDWSRRPWEGWRILRLLGIAGAAAAACFFWWRYGRRSVRWRIRGWRRRKSDPVRREAGRWLRKLRKGGSSTRVDGAVLAELQRLRYGPQPTWPAPAPVFRRARRSMRSQARAASP